jgi:RecA/RadA recombinase
MGILMQAFNEQIKNTKDLTQASEMTYSVSYPTGFLNLDFANGYIQEINGVRKFELGLSDGSINMFISDSGVGKTTLACQAACNIIKPFENGAIFYEQAEVGTNIQRIKNLSGFSDEEFVKRFKVRDAGITTQSLFRRVKMIYDTKMSHRDELTYDTGLRDLKGAPVIKFIPTLVIVDSVKMVMSEKNAENDESNNMEGATNAKANSEYYTRMVPMCRQANIIMILINHITTSINTGPFHMKPELSYLKEGEHISGGKSLTYIQNNIFRLDISTKFKLGEGFNIIGSAVNIDIVKSRTNKTSRARCELVFDQDTGYDPDLSLFWMLKQNKLLEGSGAYLKVPGCETKFAQRQFKEVLYSDKDFYNAFVNVCYGYLTQTLIEEYERVEAEKKNRISAMSPYEAILAKLNE